MYGIELTATELGLISSAVVAISGFGGWLLQRRKVGSDVTHASADASAITVQSALSLLEPMRAEIAELRAELVTVRTDSTALRHRVDELEARESANSEEIAHLREGVEVLTGQVLELGKTPLWPPASGGGWPMA